MSILPKKKMVTYAYVFPGEIVGEPRTKTYDDALDAWENWIGKEGIYRVGNEVARRTSQRIIILREWEE